MSNSVKLENNGALRDVRIIDLTRVLAGPICTMILADMGAEVIKIERPGKGDDTRDYGPYQNGESMIYANINRNKKGVTLNLKSPEGKEMLLKMVKDADVVVENYRPGVMDKLGLGYDVLKEVNPRIIYTAISGFGSYGKYSARPGYDVIAQAYSGIMEVTGWPDSGPSRVGYSIGDVSGGVNGALGTLAALHAREVTGVGQRVDVALVDGLLFLSENCVQRYLSTGKLATRNGTRAHTVYPYDAFPAKDGLVLIACANQKIWEIFATKALKNEALITDERFLTNPLRDKNWKELRPFVVDWVKDYTIKEAIEFLQEIGVPAAPINNMQNILDDEHFIKDREMFVPVKDEKRGDMMLLGDAVKLMGTPSKIRWLAPDLGQDNEEVYMEMFGLSKDEFAHMKEVGAI